MTRIAYGIAPSDGQVDPDERADVPLGAEFLRHAAFRHGCSIVLEPRFDAEDMLALIERHRVTHMHMVPTMFVRLLRLPGRRKRRYDLSSLRFVVHGAAPCPPHVKRAMIDWWGPVINEYYGSTETGIPVWHSAQGGAGEARHRRQGDRRRHRQHLRGRTASRCRPDEVGEIFMRQTAVPDFTYHGKAEARARPGGKGSSPSATSATSTRTAICSSATASATW